MNKIYYNIQLISSFLLDKTRFLFIFLLFLLNGNNIISLILCEEQIDASRSNQEEIINQNKDTNWYPELVLACLGIVLIITYFYFSGGSDSDTASSILTDTRNQNINTQINPEATFRLYENLVQGAEAKAQTAINEKIMLEVENRKLGDQNKVLEGFVKGLNSACHKHENHITKLESRQDSVYNFLGELFVKNTETQEEITRFMRENPPVPHLNTKK